MKMFVMLIWLAVGDRGAPATITGFQSINACDAQKSIIIEGYKQISAYTYTVITTACVELHK